MDLPWVGYGYFLESHIPPPWDVAYRPLLGYSCENTCTQDVSKRVTPVFLLRKNTHSYNKQLLDEVEYDITDYQKPRSVLSAEAEG